jgi:hypothetical protein
MRLLVRIHALRVGAKTIVSVFLGLGTHLPDDGSPPFAGEIVLSTEVWDKLSDLLSRINHPMIIGRIQED